jgi:hypothetical protein
LVRGFLDDRAGAPFAGDPGAERLVVELVDFRCDQQGGDPERWSPAAAERFLLDWIPGLARAGQPVDQAPDVLWEWVRWAAPRADLPPTVASRTLTRIGQLETAFAREVRIASGLTSYGSSH